LRAFRIFARKHRATAFTGEGARHYGGRWNSPGLAAVYASTFFSLALLEIVTNARGGHIPPDMLYCVIEIPDSIRIDTLDETSLPEAWFAYPAPATLQAIGDNWLASGSAVALLVPSAIARIEHNLLLNPAHPDFSGLIIGEALPVPVDSRLSHRHARARFGS
jgi:RES domain-containing protein